MGAIFSLATAAPGCADLASADESGGYDGGSPNPGIVPESDSGSEPEAEPEPDVNAEPSDPPPECDAETPVTLYLSPDDSNSMSSPVQARTSILGTHTQFPVRTWEFMNYYTFDYPAAEPGTLRVTTELIPALDEEPGAYILQIAVTSEHIADDARKPMNITLVLDESGSMSGLPIDLLKESSLAIAASLREGDIISLVTWDVDNAIRLRGYRVTGPNDPDLLAVINAISSGGGTDLHGGLVAGYALATESYNPDRINRIVLISDGGANAGVTDVELIARKAAGQGSEGIYMVGVGVADGGYNDELMDIVTDAGKGAAAFIPDRAEAWKVFNTDFVNTMAVAARDVQLQLDLPPGFEIVRFSGEEYSTDPDAVEPQHLAPNDSMIFHQRIRTCAPELADALSQIGVTVRWKDAITFADNEIAETLMFETLLGQESRQLYKGAAVFEYAEALKTGGAGEPDGDDSAALAFEALDRAQAALPEDPELVEIRKILNAR